MGVSPWTSIAARSISAAGLVPPQVRRYPPAPFYAAVEHALRYGLFDLNRLERLILERVAGDFFNLDPPE